MNHIRFFVQQVETVYGKRFYGRSCGSVRPTAMYLIYKITGVTFTEVSKYFNCSISNVLLSFRRSKNYFDTGDPGFIKLYNELLDLFIKTTKIYLNDHTKRKLLP